MIFDPISLQKLRLAFLKLRAISNSSRFYLLNIIHNRQSISVTELVDLTKIEQAIVSQHLAILKKAELVKVSAHKKNRFYTIQQPDLQNLLLIASKITHHGDATDELKNSYVSLLAAYQYLKTLLHPGRLSIIEVLDRMNEASVNQLTHQTNSPQSMTSQNLKILLDLKIVEKSNLGRSVIYKINHVQITKLKALEG